MTQRNHGRRNRGPQARRGDGEVLRRLRTALETMQLGVTITDRDGRIVYINPADARTHGYEVAELLGRDVGIFALPPHRHPVLPHDLGVLSSWRRESVNVRKDGSVFPVQLLSDIVRDSRGEPIGVITTCEDITDRKRSEQALRDAYAALDGLLSQRAGELGAVRQQLEREIEDRARAERDRLALAIKLRQAAKLESLGGMSAGIAHDLNNLLAVILATVENLAGQRGTPARPRAGLDDIGAAARSGAALVQRLLNMGRQADLQRAPTDLRRLVGDLLSRVRSLVPATIDVVTSGGEGEAVALADPLAVERIVLNLVANARDAMPHGGTLTIDVSRDARGLAQRGTASDAPATVRLSVADTGIGMSAETRARLFEPYFTTKPSGRGTGLGLATVRALVEQHDGDIEIDSTEGAGTAVRVWFPSMSAPPRSFEGLPRAVAPPSGSETVLLVDDNETLRRAGRRALEKLGYRVLTAADGVEALERIGESGREIGLVVCDVAMPRMDGPELLRRLRTDGREVPFLFVSGDCGAGNGLRARVGAAPCLLKPWTVEQLARGVRELLDRPPAGSNATRSPGAGR